MIQRYNNSFRYISNIQWCGNPLLRLVFLIFPVLFKSGFMTSYFTSNSRLYGCWQRSLLYLMNKANFRPLYGFVSFYLVGKIREDAQFIVCTGRYSLYVMTGTLILWLGNLPLDGNGWLKCASLLQNYWFTFKINDSFFFYFAKIYSVFY